MAQTATPTLGLLKAIYQDVRWDTSYEELFDCLDEALLGWVRYGWLNLPASGAANNQFQINGDVVALFPAGRKVRAVLSASQVIVTVNVATYGSNVTTVTIDETTLDGTLTDVWVNAFALLYASGTTFTVAGDKTAIFQAGLALKVQLAASTVYCKVQSSSYSSPNTTVTITGATLTDPIRVLWISPVRPSAATDPNLPSDISAGADHGQCLLEYVSATQIKLSRRNGKYLLVKTGGTWSRREIPSAGIILGNGSLSASTLYRIYVYDDGGTLTLEASTTAHATDGDTGVEIKSADASRTFVGAIYTNASSQFGDSASQRYVRSWFNRSGCAGHNYFAADRTTASASYVELSSSERGEAVMFADEAVSLLVTGRVTSATGANPQTSIGIDGTTAEDTMSYAPGGGGNYNLGCGISKVGLSEGLHYFTILGLADGAQTCTWRGTGTAGDRCSISFAVHRP
ncbi:MAG: hypothetical protein HY510_07880 [Acidobacteria bacterium]|nr:hypothetical protein [Acidobacteriota bacterium]